MPRMAIATSNMVINASGFQATGHGTTEFGCMDIMRGAKVAAGIVTIGVGDRRGLID